MQVQPGQEPRWAKAKPNMKCKMARDWVFRGSLHPGGSSRRIHAQGTPSGMSCRLARLSQAPQGLLSPQQGQTPLCFS